MTSFITIPERVDNAESGVLLRLHEAVEAVNQALWQCGLYYDSGIPFEAVLKTVGVRRERETSVISTPQLSIEVPRSPEPLESILARITVPP